MIKKAVVLLSGGRDSFLAACLAIEQGYTIVPLICNNGHMEGIHRAISVVSALQSHYGRDMVGDLVESKTAMTLQEYVHPLWYTKPSDLTRGYPELQMYQAHCLSCKTAMYVHAIAYCLANDITHLVDGVRESQEFFVDKIEMKQRFEELCAHFGIILLTPVYHVASDLKRKRMLCDRNLPTKTWEPQCFLGCPLQTALSDSERKSLSSFYDKELNDVARKDILELCSTKKMKSSSDIVKSNREGDEFP